MLAGRQLGPLAFNTDVCCPNQVISVFFHKRKGVRFKCSKRSLSITHIMASGDTCPQGTSNACHVATLAGLKTGTGNGFALRQTKGFG